MMILLRWWVSWRVIGGLLLMGCILVVMVPILGIMALPVLLTLACPLSMLILIVILMKDIKVKHPAANGQHLTTSLAGAVEGMVEQDKNRLENSKAQINRLKAQVTFLQSQQEALVSKVVGWETSSESILKSNPAGEPDRQK
ncbi:MAG: hypothetical protein J0I20_22675 [Chloroflexi bacterium]|nr:hypothetical protein [Chloroflexota bacterium]